MMQPLLAAAVAFVIASALTPLMRHYARRLRLLDVPNERSSHTSPTPRNGGYAIAIGMLAAILVFSAQRDQAILVICAGVIAVGIAAAADELRPIPNALRFIIQLVVAGGTVIVAGLQVRAVDLPFVGPVHFAILGVFLSVFWIAGVLNGFNFMDGLNGIASVEAIICGATLCALFARLNDASGMIYAAAVAGAAAGFLPWNFPGGSIFMGDVGSTALGFSLGALVLRVQQHGGSWIAAALPLAPFLFDTAVTLVRRIVAGEAFFYAHRSHFYQRLNQAGWSHAAVTSLWGALAIVSSAAALLYDRVSDGMRVALLAIVLGVHVAIAGWITVLQRAQRGTPADGPRH